MWERGDVVWANVAYPNTWLPGQVLDPSEPDVGVLVSFFDLRKPRYFVDCQLRSFGPDFRTFISNSLSFRFVKQALRALSRNIARGLCCPCQEPSISSRGGVVRESCFHARRFRAKSALRFVRNVSVSPWLPLEGLCEAACRHSEILCFRRYTVDYNLSKSVYQEIHENANSVHGDGFDVNPRNLMSLNEAHSLGEMLNNLQCLAVDPMSPERAGLVTGNGNELLISIRDMLLQGISSCCSKKKPPVVGSEVEFSYTGNNITTSLVDSMPSDSFLKACKTMDRSMNGANAYPSKSRARCEPGTSDALVTDSSCAVDTQNATKDRTQGSNIRDAQENCCLTSSRPLIAESETALIVNLNDGSATSAEQLSHFPVATDQDKMHIRSDNSVASRNTKRKRNDNVAYLNSSKRNKVAHLVSFNRNPQVAQKRVGATCFANCRSLHMKFPRNHRHLPSKGDLVKKFSAFGKIDTSRTEVYPHTGTAEVVFMEGLDAVVAYQYAKSQKVVFGRSNVLYQLDPFEQNTKGTKVSMPQKAEEPSPKSCLKPANSLEKHAKRKELRVRFLMETDG